VPKIFLHVLTQRAMIRQNPVDALQVQNIAFELTQRLAVPAVVVLLQILVDHFFCGFQVCSELGHFLNQDFLIERLCYDERIVGCAI